MTRSQVFSTGQLENGSYNWHAYTDLPVWSTTLLGVVLIGFALVGVLGNLLIISVYVKYKKMRTVRSRIYVSLAVADMMIAVTMSPFAAVASFERHWFWGKSGCQWYGFAGFLFGVASMNSLAVISVERWLTICKPDKIKINLDSNPTHANIAVAIVWVYSFIWAVMPFCGWSTYVLEPYNISCTINWFSSALEDVLFVLLSFIFVVALDITIMIISYSCICHRLICQSNTTLLNAFQGRGPRVGCSLPVKWEIRVTFISFLMVFSYILCWMPYCAISIWASFNDLSGLSMQLASIGPTLAKAACLFNPIIYAAYNKNFRKGAISFMLCKKFIEDRTQPVSTSPREHGETCSKRQLRQCQMDAVVEVAAESQRQCQMDAVVEVAAESQRQCQTDAVVEVATESQQSERHHGARILNWITDSAGASNIIESGVTAASEGFEGRKRNEIVSFNDKIVPCPQPGDVELN